MRKRETKAERKAALQESKQRRLARLKVDCDEFFSDVQKPKTDINLNRRFIEVQEIINEVDRLQRISNGLDMNVANVPATIEVGETMFRTRSLEIFEKMFTARKNLKEVMKNLRNSSTSMVEPIACTFARLTYVIRYALKNSHKVVILHTLADEVFTNRSKGVYNI